MSEIKSTNKYLIKRKYKTIDGNTYPMDEYQAILVEEDSENCGFIRPQYQWSATTGYICDFETYTKYSRDVKMVSYDSGVTWSVKQPVEERRGEVIAYDSYDCGKPMYRCVETDETYCEDNGDDYAISYFFSGNDTDVPDLTIPCTNGIINNQDEDLFAYGSSRKPDPSTVTRTVIGDCVTELDDLFWQYSASTLTVGNSVRKINVRTIGVPSHDANQRAFISSLSNPIVLPRSVRTIKEESTNYSSGVTINIKPLANPSDFLIEGYSTSLPKCTYKLVATYGTSFSWKEAMSLENVSGCTVYQEDYQTPNKDWKVKITFEDNSVNYLADDPTHVLGANEIARMSNVLADSHSSRHWISGNNEVFVGTNFLTDGQRIKEIEIASSVSAITENAIKNYYSYICNYKLNEGLLVFGDAFNNRISPYSGNEYHNYTITMPSTLTAITSYSICPNHLTYNGVTYGYTLKFTSVIPPRIENNGALNNVVKILVPCGSLNRYLTEWSQYADKIEPISYECLHNEWKNEGSFVCVDDKLCTVERLYKCLNSDVCYPTEETRTIETSGSCNGYTILDKMVVDSGDTSTTALFYGNGVDDFDAFRVQFAFDGYEKVNNGSGGITLMNDENNSYCSVSTSLESQTQNSKAKINFTLAFNNRTHTTKRREWNINATEFEIGTIYVKDLLNNTIDGNKDDPAYVLDISNRNFVAYDRHAPWKWIKVYKRIDGVWKLQKYLLPCVNNVTSDYYFFDVKEFVDDKYSE